MWTTWSCNTIAKATYLFIFLYSLLLLSTAWLLLCTYAAVGPELLCCLQAGDRQLEALDLRQELCNKWTTTIQNFNHQQQYHLVHLPRRWSALCAAVALNFQPVQWNRQIFTSWFERGVISFHQSMLSAHWRLVLPWREVFFFRLRSLIHGCSPRNEYIIWISSVKM